MQNNLAPFVTRLIDKYEGGYCWDNGDPGGPTNFGITCYDLAEERHQTMNSMAAWAPLVKSMPESEAVSIYNTKYATAIHFAALPAGPDCCEMDYAVNSGIGRVNVVRPRILALAKKPTVQACDPKWYVDAMCQERLTFMHAIRGGSAWATFGRGWGARVADLQLYCTQLTKSPAPPQTGLTKLPPVPKASHTDPQLTTHVTATVAGHAAATGTAASQGLSWGHVALFAGLGLAAIIGYAEWKSHQLVVLNKTVVLPATIPPHP